MSRSKNTVNNKAITNSKNVNISPTSIFTLLPTKEDSHEVNFYVHRSKSIRDILAELWQMGSKDKTDLATMNMGQVMVTRTNALFRLLEKYGPSPTTSLFKIIHDKKHGVSNQAKEDCVSKGFYHAHVLDRKPTYVVLWECFEDKRLINILAIAPHENFDFTQKGHKPLLSMQQAMEAAKKANFECGKPFNQDTYSNQIYPK